MKMKKMELVTNIRRLLNLLDEKDREIDKLTSEVQRLNKEIDNLTSEVQRLNKILPPDPRGQGFVGEGSLSVFAMKVVEERDALAEKCALQDKLINELKEKGAIDQFHRSLPLEDHYEDQNHKTSC